jgi:hypothetical protein
VTGEGVGADQAPDATQPRVTVRPKPPVLLGATSTTGRWHRAGIVSDNPGPGRSRRLQGSHRDAPRTISGRILLPTPVTPPLRGSLPFLDPALQRSLGFPPFCLAASLRASLAPTLRCSLEVRRALVSELTTDCATPLARSMAIREIQTFSPPFFGSSPSDAVAVPSSSPCRGRPSSIFAASPSASSSRSQRPASSAWASCRPARAPLTSQLFPPLGIAPPPRSAPRR